MGREPAKPGRAIRLQSELTSSKGEMEKWLDRTFKDVSAKPSDNTEQNWSTKESMPLRKEPALVSPLQAGTGGAIHGDRLAAGGSCRGSVRGGPSQLPHRVGWELDTAIHRAYADNTRFPG